MNKFDNFISYLKRETRDVFYIELSEIEDIIKCPLSDSAYKYLNIGILVALIGSLI